MTTNSAAIPPEWRTHAELTNYCETPRYEETIAYAKRLAKASPMIRYESFGKSGEGRDLPLLIATGGDTFTPDDPLNGSRKAVVLIQACIHSGEPDGKDAGLALLRDIAITKTHPDLLKRVVVLFIPIYNCDGHERISPYNRINQNGPSEMGWRGTTTNQNLNRDYMKADTPETRAWLALWNRWNPDLFIDCHVTDGADYGSVITYHFEHHAGIAESVLEWERAVIQGRVGPATEAAGSITSWYLEFIDNRDLTLGMRDFNGSPRFSTGYVPLRNRPAILIETHMLKDYRARVIGTYDFLRFAIAEVNQDPKRLINAGRQADENTTSWGRHYDRSRQFPLRFELTDEARPFHLRAVESKTTMSEISGAPWVEFGAKPLELTVPMRDTFRVTRAVAPPLAYIVPPQWREVIQNIIYHGLELQRTVETAELEVESYRFQDVQWAGAPFEGRFLTTVTAEPIVERRVFPAGSVVVPTAQPLAKVAISLLEPEAPDSLIVWSFFSAIFEEKEYGEDYILEKLARDMVSKQPEVAEEFQKRLADPSFAADPRGRLEFFYQRSPYWDPYLNLYPVGRLTAPLDVKTEVGE
jgi:murein tripeptide amidase MpaA